MLSSVTINCQVTMIVMNSGSQFVRIAISVSNVTSLQHCLFNCQKLSKIVKIVKNCHKKKIKIVKNCQNVGQVMFPHQMSQRSQVSRDALCMSKKVSQSASQSVTRSPIELFWTAKNRSTNSSGA